MSKKIQHKFPLQSLDGNAISIIENLNKNGFKAYLVGGCIRDLLLDLQPKDFDISTNATPEQIVKIFKRARIIGKRFQIVHILFKQRDFYEISTFRGSENNTTILKNDNNFGNIETDAWRRDFTINSLYYDVKKHQIIDLTNSIVDIENKIINIIGEADLRFNQDPVRILRALRFCVKLDFTISDAVQKSIKKNKHLLQNIPAARLFEECLKLFHSAKSYKNYKILQKFGVLQYLFPQNSNEKLIKVFLENTSSRIVDNLGVSAAFIFVVFLYNDYLAKFEIHKKQITSLSIAGDVAAKEVICNQHKIVTIPKWASVKIQNTWRIQRSLIKMQSNKVHKILALADFRMAFDLLVLLSNSTNPNLKKVVDFWNKAQN